MRRWRGLVIRRGKILPFVITAVPSNPPPPYIKQAGPKPRIGLKSYYPVRRFNPAWPQSNQGQNWPSYIRQQKSVYPRATLNLLPSQRRRFDPPWPVLNPYPIYIKQAATVNPRGLRIIHSRRFDPAWPQANQGNKYPNLIRQPRVAYVRAQEIRVVRSRRYEPIFTTPATWHPPVIRNSFKPYVRPPRGKVLSIYMPQVIVPVVTPIIIKSRYRAKYYIRVGRILPTGKAGVTSPAILKAHIDKSDIAGNLTHQGLRGRLFKGPFRAKLLNS